MNYPVLVVLLMLMVVPVVAKEKVNAEYRPIESYSGNFLTAVKQFFLLQQKEVLVYEVVVQGKHVAYLDNDSPLIGIEVHDICLQYQFGTDAFLGCEAGQ